VASTSKQHEANKTYRESCGFLDKTERRSDPVWGQSGCTQLRPPDL